jgi:ELWxxDGT repeat protein
MLRSFISKFLPCLVVLALILPSQATVLARPAADLQPPHLVKDINAAPESSSPSPFLAVNNKLFFAATDFEHGRELWKVEGNPPEASLVKDIIPGRDGGLQDVTYRIAFGSLGSNLFFRAYTPADGEELWKSDGTLDGTVMLKDLYPGCTQPAFGGCKVNSSNPQGFFAANGFLFFLATDGTGMHLWRTDGTPGQTVRVNDLIVEDYWESMAFLNGWIYLSANDPAGALVNHGRELWRTNGQPGSAELVADINLSGDAYPSHLTVSGENLYYAANDGVHGSELWKTGPTGTALVKDILPGADPSSPHTLVNFNNALFLAATIASNGKMGLLRSDGTESGTTLIAAPDACSPAGCVAGGVNILAPIGDQLFFRASEMVHGEELWKTDGTPQNTGLIKDIFPGVISSGPGYDFSVLGENLIFIAFDSCNNNFNGNQELWRSDGSADGTTLLKDIHPGSEASYPNFLTRFEDRVYFSADDGLHGAELWSTDGTSQNTAMLMDINPHTPNANIVQMTPFGNKLFFGASDGKYEGPWISDGSEAGTIPLAVDPITGLGPGIYTQVDVYSDPDLWPVNATGRMYFLAKSRSPAVLWRSDGTPAGTEIVSQLPSLPRAMTSLGADAYGLSGNSDQMIFWRARPTGGLEVVKSFPGIGWNPSGFTRLKGQLYFFVHNTLLDQDELWTSDGTPTHTLLVKKFSGTNYMGDYSHALSATNTLVFFNFNTTQFDWEMWQSDGTEQGTVLVEDEVQGGSLFVNETEVINDTLYFVGEENPPTPGRSYQALYKTRGLETGIERVASLGGLTPAGENLTSIGSTLYFLGTGRNELWKSDGTAAGTYAIRPGLWIEYELVPFFNKLYFGAKDADHGMELWSSDGTSNGTQLAADIFPGALSSFNDYALKGFDWNIKCLAAAGKNLFLAVEDGQHGAELWVLPMELDQQVYLPAV